MSEEIYHLASFQILYNIIQEKCQAAQKVLANVEQEILASLTEADKNDMYRIFKKLLNYNK